MPRLISLTCLLALTVAAGCANRSLSAHQCQAGDWQTVGYRDGVNGKNQSHLLEHQNACGRHNIVPDAAGYRSGWAQGIREYCQPQRAYDLGVSGGRLRSVCPADLSTSYRAAFEDGRVLYLARHEVNRLENKIARDKQRIDAIGNELIDTATAQVDPTLTTQDRLDLLADSKALMDERDRLSRGLPGLAVDLDRAIVHLDEVQQSLAQR